MTTQEAAPVLAIDGPAASGKGTIALNLARALGFRYLDSGALYRLVALKAQREGVASDDSEALAKLAVGLDIDFDHDRVLLDGADVTQAIRGESVSADASRVAVHAPVRQALLARQRAFRAAPGLVAEGRDMGTVVFPDAEFKVFLTATPEARAGRRHKQLIAKGNPVTLAGLLRDIRDRDARDSTRAAAPLRPAPDAVLLDTTDLTIDEATDAVLHLYRSRFG